MSMSIYLIEITVTDAGFLEADINKNNSNIISWNVIIWLCVRVVFEYSATRFRFHEIMIFNCLTKQFIYTLNKVFQLTSHIVKKMFMPCIFLINNKSLTLTDT